MTAHIKLTKREKLETKLNYYIDQYNRGVDLYTSDYKVTSKTSKGLRMMTKYDKKRDKTKKRLEKLNGC